MFSLLNFPYNLKEMVQDDNEQVNINSFEEKLKSLLNVKNMTRQKFAQTLTLKPEQWEEWLRITPLSSELKSAISNLPSE